MTVKELRHLLSYFKPELPVRVLSDDGVEQLEFARPIVTRYNAQSPHEFVAINVKVSS